MQTNGPTPSKYKIFEKNLFNPKTLIDFRIFLKISLSQDSWCSHNNQKNLSWAQYAPHPHLYHGEYRVNKEGFFKDKKTFMKHSILPDNTSAYVMPSNKMLLSNCLSVVILGKHIPKFLSIRNISLSIRQEIQEFKGL